jgi:signal transduction histidine kinase
MTTTILKVSGHSLERTAVARALTEAGIGSVHVENWEPALPGAETDGKNPVPAEVMRSLSHDLRTPLSAMAGWLHLMESGKLDEAGLKRAITKLRGNIEDQVKTIDRYLGTTTR